MDLFDYMRETSQEKEAPLASRMRPATLDEVVGQQHIIGKDKLLYRAIKADKLSSVIFYGPPGTGKTTLASLISASTGRRFEALSALNAGVKEVRAVIERDGLTREEVLSRMKNQFDYEKNPLNGHTVIENDGDVAALKAAVEQVVYAMEAEK